jgi:5'-nucleotidase/UDP-sugar diphosphatase
MHRVIALVSLAVACGSGSSPRKLVILHSNDEHSHLFGYGPEADEFPAPTTAGSGSVKGGAGRRLVALQSARSAASASGADSLTLSAGDNMMGTLMEVPGTTMAPDYRVMKLLGYDATTLGNHEFDFTPAGLAAAVKVAQGSAEGIPQIVATNIHFGGTAGDASLSALFDENGTDLTKPIHRTLILTTPNGLKVGFIGILGADAAAVAPLKAPVTFSIGPGSTDSDRAASLKELIAEVQPFVDLLRHNGVDLVVALSHSGATVGNAASEDFQIAQQVDGIDVIVSGHTHTEVPATVLTGPSGRSVLVQQAGRYGDHFGRISLSVQDGKVTFDTANSGLVAVDDNVAAAPGNPVDAFIATVVTAIETQPLAAGKPSFLAYSLAESLHKAPPALTTPGSYYNFPVLTAQTFDVDNTGVNRETELLDLSADAQLAAANAAVLAPTQLAVEASGVLRVPSLLHSKSNKLGFGDIFAAVPLGISPTTGTPGYPLCRFFIFLGEIKATFEVTASYSYDTDADLFVVPSGFRFEYDTTRKEFSPSGSISDVNNGRVTRIDQLSAADLAAGNFEGAYDTVWDVTKGGWLRSPATLVSVAASLYIAEFAAVAGVTLKDQNGTAIPNNDPARTILLRADGTEIKEWEALASYVSSFAAAGALPARYQLTATADVPRRATCVGANAAAGYCAH